MGIYKQNAQERKRQALAKKKIDFREKDRLGGFPPVAQWDRAIFNKIASDRGYRTKAAISYAVSQELELPLRTAQVLIKTGRMTWGQCLLIGALFEMTPKEFADCFMKDYFKEVRDGEYIAYVEDKTSLRSPPAMYIK